MVFGPVSGFTQPWWSSRSCVIKLDIIGGTDRKSTRLNSSHDQISYAVFCLKKKKIYQRQRSYQNNKHQCCRDERHDRTHLLLNSDNTTVLDSVNRCVHRRSYSNTVSWV